MYWSWRLSTYHFDCLIWVILGGGEVDEKLKDAESAGIVQRLSWRTTVSRVWRFKVKCSGWGWASSSPLCSKCS
jgi:hypothetical protein